MRLRLLMHRPLQVMPLLVTHRLDIVPRLQHRWHAPLDVLLPADQTFSNESQAIGGEACLVPFVSTAGGGGVGGLLSFEALLDGASKDHGFASGGRPLIQLVPAMKSVS